MPKSLELQSKDRPSGFTLIELLMVVVIIGGIMAVIIPRAWRANIEAKYGLVRQAATELGNWGMTWAERNLESQEEADNCVLNDYVATLVGYTGNDTNTNWVTVTNDLTGSCRSNSGTGIAYAVAEIMPPEKQLRNPFNGLSYFNPKNDGNTLQSGLLYLGRGRTGSGTTTDPYVYHYYFVYTGTSSDSPSEWYDGMGSGTSDPFPLANIRNGIFMARLQP